MVFHVVAKETAAAAFVIFRRVAISRTLSLGYERMSVLIAVMAGRMGVWLTFLAARLFVPFPFIHPTSFPKKS